MDPLTSLAALVSALPVGLLVETPDRRVQVANQAFCDIFGIGVPAEQLVGADCAAAAEGVADQFEDPSDFLRRIEQILAAHRSVRGEEIAMRDGRVLERDFLVVDLGQGTEQIIWVYKDVTALATARRSATAARDQAVGLARQRSTMLATVTHEVRTPLVGLVGLTEALEAAPLPGWAHDAITAIRASADSLTQLLEDLLDLGRLDVDARALRATPYNVESLLAEAVETVGVTARRSGVLLISSADESLPPLVVGDAPRLRQVVLNLVANAVRAAASGEVTVTGCGRDGGLQICVEDNGPGIAPDLAERMFDPWVQGESGPGEAARGAGLGLAITAQIVERMGGQISVEHRQPQGTRFVVMLPLQLPRSASASATEPWERPLEGLRIAVDAPTDTVLEALSRVLHSRGAVLVGAPDAAPDAVVTVGDATDAALHARVAASRRRHPDARHVVLTRRTAPRDAVAEAVTLGLPPSPDRLVTAIHGADERLVTAVAESLTTPPATVLLAEDDDATRTLVARMLTQLGATVQAVGDGESAVDAALSTEPDVVLLDLRLPQLPGIEAVRRIRADDRGRDLNLVVVSASGSDSARSQALAAGADAYLAKPVTRDQLHELLVSLVPAAPSPRTDAPSTDAQPRDGGAVEIDRLDQLALEMGDAGIVREAVEVFLDELPTRLASITRAVSGADLEDVHEKAHALGSPALMLGATQLGQRCRSIEATTDMASIRSLADELAVDSRLTDSALRDYLTSTAGS